MRILYISKTLTQTKTTNAYKCSLLCQSLSSFFFPVHDQTHLHGWLKLLNAQINPLPRRALVRHGSWNLILDISVMTFACSWEECGWQSGDDLTTSCCESCRPSKHKNENVTWKALLAAGRWCRLAPLGSAALCGSVFSGLKITHLPFSSVFFSFFFGLLRSGGWVRCFPLQ